MLLLTVYTLTSRSAAIAPLLCDHCSATTALRPLLSVIFTLRFLDYCSMALDKFYLRTDNACHNFHQLLFYCTTFRPLGLLQVHTLKTKN